MTDLLTITTRTGRVLMRVARVGHHAWDGLFGYTGDGIGGVRDRDGCLMVARTVLADAPRARVTGEWAGDV
jgi:hypothetical protein